MLGIVPAPECIQMVAVLMCQFILALHPLKLYWYTAMMMIQTMAGEEYAPHLDDEENLSQGTVSLPDISASDDEGALKAIVCETVWKSDAQYDNW